MNRLSIITIAALALTACSESNSLELAEGAVADSNSSSQPVTFNTYIGLTSKTRAGAFGGINTEVLMKPDYGFGVFAYQTGTGTYADYRTQDGVARRYPNFMYNEHIVYSETEQRWVYYTPANTRYWPNEVSRKGTDDQNNDSANDRASTEWNNGGNVSFFAYAPYVEQGAKVTVPGITGQTLTDNRDGGIVSFSTPNFNGGKADAANNLERYRYSDPYVRYKIAQKNSEQVDLLWATTVGSSENVLSEGIQPGVNAETYPDFWNDGTEIKNDYTTDPAKPLIIRPVFNVPADLTKQKTNGTVNLLFKHALAKIGGSYVGPGDGSDEDGTTPTNGLMVILDIDKDGKEFGGSLYPYIEGPTATTPYNTKVTINEIVLESERQLTDEGRNNIADDLPFNYEKQTEYLHNTGILNLVTGIWTNGAYEAYASGETTRTQTIVPSGASFGGSTSDDVKDAVLSRNLAEPTSFTTSAYTRERYEELPVGVTTVAKNVYENEVQPFVFIPGTHPVITITIDYTVRSYDAKLADNYTEVRQRITKRLYILDEILLNKQYNILMHLGLTSVKFTATVSDWDVTDITGTTTDPADGTSPVSTFDGEELEHVYLPINVAALRSCAPAAIGDFTSDGGSRDLGIVTFTYDDDTTHDSREPAMTFAIAPADATVTVDHDKDSATYGHVTLTLPQNATAYDKVYNLTVTYGDNSVSLPVTVKGI